MAGRQLSLIGQHEPQALSPVKRRLLDAACDIALGGPEELAFQHSCMAQCSLPASKPDPAVSVWDKRQGRAQLRVEAGSVIDPKTRRYVRPGLPYGPKARLLLMHLNTEAIRSGSPVIPVEDSMTAFFRRLMGKTQDGRQAKMLKHQLTALAAANFHISIVYDDERAVQMNSHVVAAFDLWFPDESWQRILWPSTLRLSTDYFESLTRYAVPLDERAIAALAHSAMALDIYAWLAQRLHRIPEGRPQFVPWALLHEQFGQDYARIRKFREIFFVALRQVQAAYPEAKLAGDGRGMMLHRSSPPVRKRLVTVGECAVWGGELPAPSASGDE
jgi:Plasmid encoded RepA protein